jgi:hypothetical protein
MLQPSCWQGCFGTANPGEFREAEQWKKGAFIATLL